MLSNRVTSLLGVLLLSVLVNLSVTLFVEFGGVAQLVCMLLTLDLCNCLRAVFSFAGDFFFFFLVIIIVSSDD